MRVPPAQLAHLATLLAELATATAPLAARAHVCAIPDGLDKYATSANSTMRVPPAQLAHLATLLVELATAPAPLAARAHVCANLAGLALRATSRHQHQHLQTILQALQAWPLPQLQAYL
jgi:hypothetical protein